MISAVVWISLLFVCYYLEQSIYYCLDQSIIHNGLSYFTETGLKGACVNLSVFSDFFPLCPASLMHKNAHLQNNSWHASSRTQRSNDRSEHVFL